ncbi:hypothetical protein LCGC14_2822090 [marine sediment metagenome]|uniref:Uncharacterized protein n=1 Tax=marine sediment metagenome TaxID=412755 RepID=A0A0F8YGP1_9ZZZZ
MTIHLLLSFFFSFSLLNKERILLSSSSFRNPACEFPRTGLAPQSKDPFLKPSYVLFRTIPLDTIPIYHTPFVLFNAFTHRLTSPPVKISQYVSFVETCLGSQHPFRLGTSVVRSLLQPYPYHYSMAFAFSSILYPLSLPLSSRSRYHNTYVYGTYWVYQVPYARRSTEPLGRYFPPVA